MMVKLRDYLDLGSEVHIDIFDDRMEIYSPGGMYDGSLVQELDTDHVPSRRRNPIIADIFSRTNYMEHRAAGLRRSRKTTIRRSITGRKWSRNFIRRQPHSG